MRSHLSDFSLATDIRVKTILRVVHGATAISKCDRAVNATLHRVVASVSWALARFIDWTCYSLPSSFDSVYDISTSD